MSPLRVTVVEFPFEVYEMLPVRRNACLVLNVRFYFVDNVFFQHDDNNRLARQIGNVHGDHQVEPGLALSRKAPVL